MLDNVRSRLGLSRRARRLIARARAALRRGADIELALAALAR